MPPAHVTDTEAIPSRVRAFATSVAMDEQAFHRSCVWERIVETIDLGDDVPLETPEDHWSLRDPSRKHLGADGMHKGVT